MTSDEDEFIIGQRGEKVRILDLDKERKKKKKEEKWREEEGIQMRTLLEFELSILDIIICYVFYIS